MPGYRKSHMFLELKEGALFLTDAHYPRHKEELLSLFDAFLLSPPPQLFLLGDMFEFLSAPLPYSIFYNKELIERINLLSQKTELIYLEGNHDFLISALFPGAKIFPIETQPIKLSFKGKTVAVMHGDKFERLGYRAYAKIIRNGFIIRLLRFLTVDINGRFAKRLYEALLKKNLCRDFPDFEAKKLSILPFYDLDGVDILVEGHYHRRISISYNSVNYEALSAFACNKSFFKVESQNNNIRFVEMSLGAFQNEQA